MGIFETFSGVAAPLLRPNIDTDAIIPSREMKLVSKVGLGEGLFASWRYTLPGGREANNNFVLNLPEYQHCSVILAGNNFGCGSSREHAVWALAEYGIKCIVAPSFGSIFFNNCIANGLLPVELPEQEIERIAAWVEQNPQQHRVTVNLENQTLQWDQQQAQFDIDENAKKMLLQGLDPIDLTLSMNSEIDRFEQADRLARPWIYLPKKVKEPKRNPETAGIS
ncbi:3-isopropylmalate dehydratase small subunit [Zhongshania aliphaticivorans]|uniref:3-isopropylmalate dehydratase small subunit n=1 Tax=Zhongshania aliphaticivorans TaxID=1470434 RepID=A0A5S9N7B7_9GAMM|nr:3-isopropylmalate dehydratase small subunit [Zhongshania aliphaticivorans]CAA0081490.1 3-isopropylmalate dehydratase small subunit [Zhongshania aliphaticivorans]CAA0084857.1 3-isopropylmalate dehydratase small subunit [Zhongshania aliphaticivorans]